jgi:hypothetical protein
VSLLLCSEISQSICNLNILQGPDGKKTVLKASTPLQKGGLSQSLLVVPLLNKHSRRIHYLLFFKLLRFMPSFCLKRRNHRRWRDARCGAAPVLQGRDGEGKDGRRAVLAAPQGNE